MDELFTLPPTPVAMPHAYWLGCDKNMLTSALLIVQPSEFEYNRIGRSISAAKSNEYAKEVMNTLYQGGALILPHPPNIMLTSELQGLNHTGYLGNRKEIWDPDAVMRKLKLTISQTGRCPRWVALHYGSFLSNFMALDCAMCVWAWSLYKPIISIHV